MSLFRPVAGQLTQNIKPVQKGSRMFPLADPQTLFSKALECWSPVCLLSTRRLEWWSYWIPDADLAADVCLEFYIFLRENAVLQTDWTWGGIFLVVLKSMTVVSFAQIHIQLAPSYISSGSNDVGT
jgi:hypothetical protein